MTKIATDVIKALREETGAGIMRVKKVLEENDGNVEKARGILVEEGAVKAEKRAERETSQGVVCAYTHHNGKLVGLVELMCETDFVAKNELFISLASDLAMQTASMAPDNSDDLLEQEFIKYPSKKVKDLVKEVTAKTGENIRLGRVMRIELGK